MGDDGGGLVSEEVEVPTSNNVIVGLPVVVIVAVGVQTLIMLFIFAKRQIVRFALRNRRGPHVSVGQGCVKLLRREIDRRLDYAGHIRHEPSLCRPGQEASSHQHRATAVDRLKELDKVIAGYDSDFTRSAGSNVRSFLIECLSGPLCGLDPKCVHRFCDSYDHARHSYRPFGVSEMEKYDELLERLKAVVSENTENKPASPKKLTPSHKKTINRPQRRLFMQESIDHSLRKESSPLIQRTSSSVLMADGQLSHAGSTPV